MTVAVGDGWEMRLGDYRDVLYDVSPCVLITDPPFSDRVHSGQRTGSSTRKSTLTYQAWGAADAAALVGRFCDEWWQVVFSDHQGQKLYESAMERAGRYVFAPLPVVRQCPTPRLAGDGPTSAADYLTVSRPRCRLPRDRMGSRPGYYIAPHTNGTGYRSERVHPGGKSLQLMRRIVRDYSTPTDTIVDPCAGGGTTLLAAVLEGRRAIGAELDPSTFAKAAERLERETRDRVYVERPGEAPKMKQQALQLGGEP